MAGFIQGTVYLENKNTPPIVATSGHKVLYTLNDGIFLVDTNNISTRLDNYSLIQEVSASLQTQIDNVSGGSGFTPYSGVGMLITPTGADYIFNVADYISNTTVSSISANLQSQIDNITGSGGFTPFASSGITITPTSGNYIFSVTDYISKTEVINVSATLQQNIDGLTQSLSSYSTITTVANTSSDLYSIDVATSGNIVQLINGTTQSLSAYTTLGVTNSLTGQLQQSINGVSQSLSAYTTLLTTANTSATLYSIDVATSGNIVQLINGTTQSLSAYTLLSATNTISGNLYNLLVSTSGNLQQNINGLAQSLSGLQGINQCNNTDIKYTITHPIINPDFEFPVATLNIPTSSSDIFVHGITNRTSGSFDVVLTSVPTTGYSILWHLTNHSYSETSFTPFGSSSISVSAFGPDYVFDVNDYISKTEVVSLTANSLVKIGVQTVDTSSSFMLASNTSNPISAAYSLTPIEVRDAIQALPIFSTDVVLWEDFMNSTVSLSLGMSSGQGNGGAISNIQGLSNTFGVLRGACGTTSNNNGYAWVGALTNNGNLSFGSTGSRGRFHLAFRARPSLALYTGTNQGNLFLGFHDTNGTGIPTDLIGFVQPNGGNYNARTRSNNVQTSQDTLVAGPLNVFKIFEILVASDGSRVDFYIDGEFTNTITTNIPTTTARSLGVGFHTLKASTHTSSCGFDVDWVYLCMGHENSPALFTHK